MSGLTEQLRQPSGHGSIDDERCRAADEIDRLQAELNYQTARADYFNHDAGCWGVCSECFRLSAAMEAAEKARTT